MHLTARLQRSLQLALAASSLALAACTATPPLAPAEPTGDPGHAAFTLWSPGRADNAVLEQRHAGKAANPNCIGENVSPPLAWARAPAATRSFVILMDDQAGRAGLGVNHWIAYGIRADVAGLPEGASLATPAPFVAGRNSLGLAYLGPCPPRGNAPQHYVFTLIATSLEPDALAPGLDRAAVLEALKGKALGAASLVLRFRH